MNPRPTEPLSMAAASQACAQVMAPGSAIVNIGSVIGWRTASLPQASYAASKAAVIGLTRNPAEQWSVRPVGDADGAASAVSPWPQRQIR